MKILLFFILVIFIFGCGIEGKIVLEPSSVTLETDKDLYHSGELIKITSTINSPVELKDVKVGFYGIYSRRYRLDTIKTVNLVEGENKITLDYKAPSCYGCAGIKPGTYSINVDVVYSNQTLGTKTIDVEIRQ